jgi:hypothetical protein
MQGGSACKPQRPGDYYDQMLKANHQNMDASEYGKVYIDIYPIEQYLFNGWVLDMPHPGPSGE